MLVRTALSNVKLKTSELIPFDILSLFLGGDSQHPETEEAARQIGVRLGLGQS